MLTQHNFSSAIFFHPKGNKNIENIFASILYNQNANKEHKEKYIFLYM